MHAPKHVNPPTPHTAAGVASLSLCPVGLQLEQAKLLGTPTRNQDLAGYMLLLLLLWHLEPSSLSSVLLRVPALVGPCVQRLDGLLVALGATALIGLDVEEECTLTTTRGHDFKARRLSARPHVFLLRGFLSTEEIEHIVALAASLPPGYPAGWYPAETSGGSHARVHCDTCCLPPTGDSVLEAINRDVSRLPRALLHSTLRSCLCD